MKLIAQRTKCHGDHAVSDAVQTVRLHWYVSSINPGQWWVHLDPGVTGNESVSVKDLLGECFPDGWCACGGTEGSWDKLVVPASEMERLRDAIGLLAPILALVPERGAKEGKP